MTRAKRFSRSRGPLLAAAFCAGLQIASSAAAAAPPVAAPVPPSAPSSPEERLRQLDQLHADFELAKLRAAIRKANSEGLETLGGALGPGGAPPLPQFGPRSPLMNLPPINPAAPDAGKDKSKRKEKAEAAEAPAFTLVEAWGSGAERQAILHSDSGDRIVRVGDHIPLGVITDIRGGAVAYRDVRGHTGAID